MFYLGWDPTIISKEVFYKSFLYLLAQSFHHRRELLFHGLKTSRDIHSRVDGWWASNRQRNFMTSQQDCGLSDHICSAITGAQCNHSMCHNGDINVTFVWSLRWQDNDRAHGPPTCFPQLLREPHGDYLCYFCRKSLVSEMRFSK